MTYFIINADSDERKLSPLSQTQILDYRCFMYFISYIISKSMSRKHRRGVRNEAFGALCTVFHAQCRQRGRFGDAICEVALQTRWQTKIIINVPGTYGEALNAPLLEMDRIADIHSDVNSKTSNFY